MTCAQTIMDYGLRSLGFGERLLPRSDFTLCQQFTLIGSGLIWNLYFVALSLTFGFVLANGLALAKASRNPWLRCPANGFWAMRRRSVSATWWGKAASSKRSTCTVAASGKRGLTTPSPTGQPRASPA